MQNSRAWHRLAGLGRRLSGTRNSCDTKDFIPRVFGWFIAHVFGWFGQLIRGAGGQAKVLSPMDSVQDMPAALVDAGNVHLSSTEKT